MIDYLVGVSQNIVASFLLWAPVFVWHHRKVVKHLAQLATSIEQSGSGEILDRGNV